MPQYIRPVTRWAIYLRDELKCVYCDVTLQQILLERSGNFLTLDHIHLRSKGGGHEAENLVTCCYHCNLSRARRTITKFAEHLGMGSSGLRSKVRRRALRDLELYRHAARMALGLIEGFPAQKMVIDHDFLVRGQWQPENFDIQYWEHLQKEEVLFCPTCGGPKDHSPREPVYVPRPTEDEEDIPF